METKRHPIIAKVLSSLPEAWFLVLFSMYVLGSIPDWIPASQGISSLILPICSLGVLALLVKQFIHRSRILGGIFGVIFTLCSIFMFLAVLSEYKEFPTVSLEAIGLLSMGSFLTLGSLVAALIMAKKGILE